MQVLKRKQLGKSRYDFFKLSTYDLAITPAPQLNTLIPILSIFTLAYLDTKNGHKKVHIVNSNK
jgi:hypothetical protein